MKLPAKLQAIIEDFAICEGEEKIELLIEFSERMPVIPPHIDLNHDSMDLVEECMTPVYVRAESGSSGMIFYFDVPKESPTVRGFAAILAEGINGSSPEEVLNIPNDFYREMGLERVLSFQRLNGISAILAHLKRLAADALNS